MRTLTSSLLAAQKRATVVPYVQVKARNLDRGVARYNWTRLYTGSETDVLHAAAMPGDGSLVRALVTPVADNSKLYYQRVASPGPGSDFATWTYSGQYGILAIAVAALGAEVSIFWVQSDRQILRIKSTDNGQTWGSPESIDYATTTDVYGMAAAYKPNGDLAVFFTDQSTLYALKRTGGTWQSRVAWDKSTGVLSGAACVYDGDWDMVVSGKDLSANFKLWSLVWGDGADVAAGTWSDLMEMASAPAGGTFEYRAPFLDKPDLCRLFFVEKFTGTESYDRPFWSYCVPGARFVDSLWREPLPFDFTGACGLALTHSGDYCWLSTPDGVWRAAASPAVLDVSADLIAVREELRGDGGKLVIELRNDRGQYAAPGQGGLVALYIGSQIELSPGYVTSGGNEVSAGQSFSLEAYEHTAVGGKASLVLHALDGWSALEAWSARHQFRWNKSADEASVKDMLGFVLARAGIKLEVKSESATVGSFCPDFTISAGENGLHVVRKLLSFVPDLVFIEGNKAYLVNPLASDAAQYSYGSDHHILEGRYAQAALPLNRAQVEGADPGTGDPIMADRFDWAEIGRSGDRLAQISDRNLASVADAEARGDAVLRKSRVASGLGMMVTPVNCGQQLYDVVDITDGRVGLAAAKRRVLGLDLDFNPARAGYRQRLYLGAV